MRALKGLVERIRSYRKFLFAFSGIAFLSCAALIFLASSPLGFALIVPLAFGSFFLSCASFAKSELAAIPFLFFAATTLLWPLLFL